MRQRHERTENRQRHADEHDEGIAKAVELRRQHQIDEHERAAEQQQEILALLHEAPRLARVVDAITDRRYLLQRPRQIRQAVAERVRRQHEPADGHAVQLLELLERIRLHRLLQRDHRAERHQLTALRAQVIALEPLFRQAKAAIRLRDHLVAASFHAEAIRFHLAQHDLQRAADVLHRNAEPRGEFAVDADVDLRPRELQIFVDEREHAGLPRLHEHFVSHAIELFVADVPGDHELHRQSARSAGQPAFRKREDFEAADAVVLALYFLADLFEAALRVRSTV